METAFKIALAVGGAYLGYALLTHDSVRVGEEVLVSSAAFPGAATTPEIAALVPPNARIAVRVTSVADKTFAGQLVGFSTRDVQGNDNFVALTGGPMMPALDKRGVVGRRKS